MPASSSSRSRNSTVLPTSCARDDATRSRARTPCSARARNSMSATIARSRSSSSRFDCSTSRSASTLALAGQRHLGLADQVGQRRAQFVRDVVAEGRELPVGGIEPVQRGIEGGCRDRDSSRGSAGSAGAAHGRPARCAGHRPTAAGPGRARCGRSSSRAPPPAPCRPRSAAPPPSRKCAGCRRRARHPRRRYSAAGRPPLAASSPPRIRIRVSRGRRADRQLDAVAPGRDRSFDQRRGPRR